MPARLQPTSESRVRRSTTEMQNAVHEEGLVERIAHPRRRALPPSAVIIELWQRPQDARGRRRGIAARTAQDVADNSGGRPTTTHLRGGFVERELLPVGILQAEPIDPHAAS
jgi:hypothetical protein